jgi:two-component system, sensor histidine kinase RpfC
MPLRVNGEIMNKILHLFKNKSGEKNNEFEQALFRVIFTGAILVYLLCQQTITQAAITFCSLYLLVGIVLFLNVLTRPHANTKRQWIALFMDISATSYGLFLTNEVGGIFVGVYLWLIIGYGLRYGHLLLRGAHIASLIGFCSAILLNSYWQTHMHLVYGFLITLVLVPLHTYHLLQKLNAAIKKAELASQAKGQFLSHISHEIRTPLNGIVGASELLSNTQLNDEQKHLSNIMKNSSELLGQLVNNVLDLSKIESGKMTVQPVDFNLADAIAKTISLFEQQAIKKNIGLTYALEPKMPILLRSDLLHIKQVLVNLLANAVKFTEQGSVTLHVSSKDINETYADLRFEVIDTGIGMTQESLSNIFESFTQADATIKYKFGGTGLGTTISKDLVTLMGGQIGVESELGKGSTFWFEIRMEKIAADENNFAISSTDVISFKDYARNTPKNAYRILVADDNDTNRTIISKMLEQVGHKVDLVANGEQALDMLEANQYDLMILDCNMPEIGGLDVLKLNRALTIGQPQVPTIILSADATLDTIQSFNDAGADAYLTKPIDANLLLEKISLLTSKSSDKPANIISYGEAKAQIRSNENNAALIDYARLSDLAVLDRNDQFLKNLIHGFLDDTDKQIDLLDSLVKNRDYLSLNDLGHALAGSAANVGASTLAKHCQKINNIVPSDDIASIELLIKNTQDTFNKTKPQFLEYVKKYSQGSV